MLQHHLMTPLSAPARFVKIVEDFASEMNLCKSWESFPIDFTHVMEIHGKTYTSVIDHFLWNKVGQTSIIDAGVFTYQKTCLTTAQSSAK